MVGRVVSSLGYPAPFIAIGILDPHGIRFLAVCPFVVPVGLLVGQAAGASTVGIVVRIVQLMSEHDVTRGSRRSG